ncbi:MAG: BrnT family toxin [Chloroflexi bacterium]|nr:BrnT family toxin [Chloroflexota bacterium]
MEFEWNEGKATTNLSKHGVSFDEAKTVFYEES